MMLLDGCFIIELFRKANNSSLIDDRDPIFQLNLLRSGLERDLMLFENQIPFFVLQKLFQLSSNDDDDKDLIKLAVNFFLPLLPGDGHLAANSNEIDWPSKTMNLLELIYHNWLPPFAGKKILVPDEIEIKNKNWGLIQCASELVESGVKFSKRGKEESCLLDISFVNGTMQIPCITIENRTECFFRNLIAYEEYYQAIGDSHIISYMKFLDCLIRSPKDVEILVKHGILNNWLDDEVVSKMFNKVNYRVTAPTAQNFQYCEIFNEVNVYCNRRVNRWMANLNRKYLKSPWAIISVVAGFVLLLLSLIQTIFSVLAYYK